MPSRHYTAPRSVLSATTTMSQVEANLRGLAAPTTSRYTDEEHLALRAWSSAKLRQASLVEQVETLRHYPGLEPAYPRQAREALASNCPDALAKAAKSLWAQVERRTPHRAQVRRKYPLIATAILS